MAQDTTGPVFHPRLYHLMAYVCILMGDGQNCDLFLNTALQLSETQGNMLEKGWLHMSKAGTVSQPAGVGVPPGSPRRLPPRQLSPSREGPHGPFWTLPNRGDGTLGQAVCRLFPWGSHGAPPAPPAPPALTTPRFASRCASAPRDRALPSPQGPRRARTACAQRSSNTRTRLCLGCLFRAVSGPGVREVRHPPVGSRV